MQHHLYGRMLLGLVVPLILRILQALAFTFWHVSLWLKGSAKCMRLHIVNLLHLKKCIERSAGLLMGALLHWCLLYLCGRTWYCTWEMYLGISIRFEESFFQKIVNPSQYRPRTQKWWYIILKPVRESEMERKRIFSNPMYSPHLRWWSLYINKLFVYGRTPSQISSPPPSYFIPTREIPGTDPQTARPDPHHSGLCFISAWLFLALGGVRGFASGRLDAYDCVETWPYKSASCETSFIISFFLIFPSYTWQFSLNKR